MRVRACDRDGHGGPAVLGLGRESGIDSAASSSVIVKVHVSPVLYADELNLKLVYERKPNFAKAAELISGY